MIVIKYKVIFLDNRERIATYMVLLFSAYLNGML